MKQDINSLSLKELEALQGKIKEAISEKELEDESKTNEVLSKNKNYPELLKLLENIEKNCEFKLLVPASIDIFEVRLYELFTGNSFKKDSIKQTLDYTVSVEDDVSEIRSKAKTEIINNKISELKKIYTLVRKISKETGIAVDDVVNESLSIYFEQ